jgi:hypothetical protein
MCKTTVKYAQKNISIFVYVGNYVYNPPKKIGKKGCITKK